LKFEQSGIAHYFEKVSTVDEIGYPKPDTRFFSIPLKELKLEVSDVIYVGDHAQEDVPEAKKLEIPVVIVNRRGKPIPDEIRPTIEIKTLIELHNLFGSQPRIAHAQKCVRFTEV
jgi:FMN phosphatase YigB (HAD superfamily)